MMDCPDCDTSEEAVDAAVADLRSALYSRDAMDGAGGSAPTDGSAPTTHIGGTSASEVIYYGAVYHWEYVYPPGKAVQVFDGRGVCVWGYSPSATDCRGAYQYYQVFSPSQAYPLPIQGDPTGGPYASDFIWPAQPWSEALFPSTVGCKPGSYEVPDAFYCGDGRYVTTAWGLDSAARFLLSGDSPAYPSAGAADVVAGWNNRDTVYGGGADDWVSGAAGSDYVWGDDGNDWVFGKNCTTATQEQLYGGNGSDIIVAAWCSSCDATTNPCPRHINGGAGDNWIYGGPGPDYIVGGSGNDGVPNPILGCAGNDVVHTNAGVDRASGGEGNDQLFGDDGATPEIDVLWGDAGDDSLNSDNGDECYGGALETDYCANSQPIWYCGIRGDCELP